MLDRKLNLPPIHTKQFGQTSVDAVALNFMLSFFCISQLTFCMWYVCCPEYRLLETESISSLWNLQDVPLHTEFEKAESYAVIYSG